MTSHDSEIADKDRFVIKALWTLEPLHSFLRLTITRNNHTTTKNKLHFSRNILQGGEGQIKVGNYSKRNVSNLMTER